MSSPPPPELPQVVQDCHDLLGWLIPQLDKFPPNRRFTPGERVETELLEVPAALTVAAYRREVAACGLDLETALRGLHAEPVGGEYRPGAYRQFSVYARKPQLISAYPFRDVNRRRLADKRPSIVSRSDPQGALGWPTCSRSNAASDRRPRSRLDVGRGGSAEYNSAIPGTSSREVGGDPQISLPAWAALAADVCFAKRSIKAAKWRRS